MVGARSHSSPDASHTTSDQRPEVHTAQTCTLAASHGSCMNFGDPHTPPLTNGRELGREPVNDSNPMSEIRSLTRNHVSAHVVTHQCEEEIEDTGLSVNVTRLRSNSRRKCVVLLSHMMRP